MEFAFTPEQRALIADGLVARYASAAAGRPGLFNYPTGRDGLAGLGYSAEVLTVLPDAVQQGYCGVGNPFALGSLHPGESMLDIGCGAGVDALVAAVAAGPSGRVAGVDASPDMLAKARANLKVTGLANVEFSPGSAEALPFPDRRFHLVISNGVFNLVLDKRRALAEVFRVLVPGGRLQVADQVLIGQPAQDAEAAARAWSG
jgi:SAM-dependent methyltransferase